MKKRIIVLGCTGSIGKSTLELVREFPDLFEVVGLQAHSNEKQLLDLGKEFSIFLNIKHISVILPFRFLRFMRKEDGAKIQLIFILVIIYLLTILFMINSKL